MKKILVVLNLLLLMIAFGYSVRGEKFKTKNFLYKNSSC